MPKRTEITWINQVERILKLIVIFEFALLNKLLSNNKMIKYQQRFNEMLRAQIQLF